MAEKIVLTFLSLLGILLLIPDFMVGFKATNSKAGGKYSNSEKHSRRCLLAVYLLSFKGYSGSRHTKQKALSVTLVCLRVVAENGRKTDIQLLLLNVLETQHERLHISKLLLSSSFPKEKNWSKLRDVVLLLDCPNQLIGTLLTCVRGPLFTTIHNHMNVVNILLRMATLGTC